MNSSSEEYRRMNDSKTGSWDLDFTTFWDYVDMMHFSPIFIPSNFPGSMGESKDPSIASFRNSTKFSKDELPSTYQEEKSSISGKRKRKAKEENKILEKPSSQREIEILTRLETVKSRNTNLSKMYLLFLP